MLLFRASLASILAAAICFASPFASTAQSKSSTQKKTSSSHAHSTHKSSKKSHHKSHGQRGIDSSRATEIQQALIREHYMTGEPTGKWDSTTIAAMRKFQSDQGWQTKLMPDSRALVKLGLGPDYSTAINAKDVASAPAPAPATSTLPSQQTAGFAAAAGVNQ